MAIYFMTVGVLSGNQGQSAVAHCAYQSGDKLHDDADGLTKNYSRKERIVETGIAAPAHAPAWAHDRERLWNNVEKIEGTRGRYARNWMFALPNELTAEQQHDLVARFIKQEFTDRGMVADWAIHKADKQNSADNDHVHIMTTMRPFLSNGEWGQKSRTEMVRDANGKSICIGRDKKNRKRYKQKKIFTTDWNDKDTLLSIRHGWAVVTNRALEAAGYDERIDERSYAERGIDKLPQVHLGHAAAGMERRGERSRLGDINRAVAELNKERAAAKAEALATAARTPANPPVDLNRPTGSSQPKAEKSPAPDFVIPTELGARMPFLFELQARLKIQSEELSKTARKGISLKELRAAAREMVTRSPELTKVEKTIKEIDTALERNKERTEQVNELLSGEYRRDNEPTLWEILRSKRSGTEWNATRDGLLKEKKDLVNELDSLKNKGFIQSRVLETLQHEHEQKVDAAFSKLLSEAKATRPEQAQADRADRAVKSIAKEIRTVRERGQDLAGTRAKAFLFRYDGACHAVQARASTTPPSTSMASIVKAITDGSLPASQITMRTDDDGLRNWSLMTELEKDEELNKEMWKSI